LKTDESFAAISSPQCRDLEPRLRLLHELAASLEGARAAVLRSDLAGLNSQTLRQREICEALRQFKVTPSGAGDRQDRLRREAADMEARVLQLNREYAALLARARRTVDIFCRLLASSNLTYLPPKRELAISHAGTGI
jgi:hypothetical protein